MIAEGLRAYLLSQSGITDLVGQNIHPLRIPKGKTPPAITYTRVGVERQVIWCGTMSFVRSEFILNAFSSSHPQAAQIGAALRSALIDYSGMMGAVSVNQVHITADIDLVEPDPGFYYESHTYSIWHEE